MRILFISGTTTGGSGRSQRELAGNLVRRGHTVRLLVDDDRRATVTRWLYGHLSDLSIRLQGTQLDPAAKRLRNSLGRRTSPTLLDGIPHLTTALPQNALPEALRRFRPDVVVTSSVERWAWRLIHETCLAAGVPTVLYIREDDSLRHLESGAVPDVLVANAESLAERLRAQGFKCAFIPSVVDVSVTRTESSRRVVLAINPARSRGGDVVWAVAARLPEIPFVVQESWPLSGEELAEVQRQAAALPNVEFRRSAPPGPGLYGDARVLLVPYRVDNRPRVILEAQANGIPVIVADVPALVEAIGGGGISVPPESISAWADAIRSIWEDETRYDQLVDAAREHSRRPEVDADSVTERFEALLGVAVSTDGERPQAT